LILALGVLTVALFLAYGAMSIEAVRGRLEPSFTERAKPLIGKVAISSWTSMLTWPWLGR
jgi:hypothetical protein